MITFFDLIDFKQIKAPHEDLWVHTQSGSIEQVENPWVFAVRFVPIIRVHDRKWILGKGGEIFSSIPKLPAWSLRKDLATFLQLNVRHFFTHKFS